MFKRAGLYLLPFFLLFLQASCSDDVSGGVVKPDVVERGDTARRTVLVYMVAENSLKDYARYDIAEINIAAAEAPRDCRLFVYVDDGSFPVLNQYFRCTDGTSGNSQFHLFDKDVCSSDTAAFAAVVDYILKDYPTEKLDIVMWSHGDGWLRAPKKSYPQRSFGIDNGDNSYSNKVTVSMEMEELAAVLERLPVQVDRVMFDACFMQCVEVAYALRNAAEWVIASPAEIPADGADYSTMLPAFFMSDEPDDIVDVYIKAYEQEYGGAVLSAVRPGATVRLADVTSFYVGKYFNTGKRRDYDDVFAYLPGGKYSGSKKYTSFFDMNSVMLKYLTSEEYAYWRSVLDDVVAYSAASSMWYSAVCGRYIVYDDSRTCGMSSYMPQNSFYSQEFNEDFRSTEWYHAAGWDVAGW